MVKDFAHVVKDFAYPGGVADEPGFLIGAPISILYHLLEQAVFDGLSEVGFADLSPAYSPVFQLLSPDGDRVTELAEKAGTTKQAMSYLVDYLEERGYLQRIPDPKDGRAARVLRTHRGWEVNRWTRLLVQQTQADWAQLIGEDKMAQLLTVLRQLSSALGAQYEGSVADVNVLAGRSIPSRRRGRPAKRPGATRPR